VSVSFALLSYGCRGVIFRATDVHVHILYNCEFLKLIAKIKCSRLFPVSQPQNVPLKTA